MTAARTASAGSYRPLDDGVTVMPRGLVAVHVRLRLADGAEERRPRPELDVAHLVELFAGGRGQLATAARLERFQHLPIVVELRRSVAVRAREVRHPAGRHHGHALWTRSEDLAERPPPVVPSARRARAGRGRDPPSPAAPGAGVYGRRRTRRPASPQPRAVTR